MAGAFGYGADTYRGLDGDGRTVAAAGGAQGARTITLIVADGTSCRHQIHDGAGREALHVARVLAMSLDSARANPYPSPVAKEPVHG